MATNEGVGATYSRTRDMITEAVRRGARDWSLQNNGRRTNTVDYWKRVHDKPEQPLYGDGYEAPWRDALVKALTLKNQAHICRRRDTVTR